MFDRATGIRQTIFVLGTLLLSLAVAYAQPAARQSKKLEPAKIFVMVAPHAAPFYVAKELNLFKEEGMDVEVVIFASGADALDAFRAGRGQFALAGQLPTVRMWTVTNDFVGIAGIEWDKVTNHIVAKTDIKTLADLKGKKIATANGTGGQQVLLSALAKVGLKDTDLTIINVSPADSVVALSRGDVDGVAYWEPFTSQALQVMGNKAHLLTDSGPYFIGSMILNANRAWVKDHPDETAAILKTLRKAADVIKSKPENAVELVAKSMNIKDAQAKALMAPLTYEIVWRPETKSSVDRAGDFLMRIGVIKARPNYNTALDLSFLRKLAPQAVTAGQ